MSSHCPSVFGAFQRFFFFFNFKVFLDKLMPRLFNDLLCYLKWGLPLCLSLLLSKGTGTILLFEYTWQ